MIMLTTIILMTVILGLPVLVIRLEKTSKLVRSLSPIIICYLVGIGIGNIPGLDLDKELLNTVTGVSVFLAIPLLLFSANFYKLIKVVRPALFSFFLGIVAVVICAVAAYLIFGGQMDQPDAAAGMMIGVYTGGTPNMSAIGIALDVEEEVFILLNSADIVFSGIYFIFLLTIGRRVLGRILPSFKKRWENGDAEETDVEVSSFRQKAKYVTLGFLLSVLSLGVAIGLSALIMKDWTIDKAVPLIILGITTLGIGASFNKRIRELPQTFSTASYLLLVFAVAMGSMANFSELIAASSNLFLFCGFVVFGSVLLHILFAFIFKCDRDTMIIASTAAIFGPAFIGPVAASLGNKEIIAVGIALGLIGYAIGNYLGLGLAFILN